MSRQHWFEPVAEHLGAAYLRYSFTKGTDQEVGFLVGALGLGPASRVLDVGCGPGRHAYGLAEAGCEVLGVDISQRFVDLAREGAPARASFERMDARALPFDAEFDAVISLCQGGFGLAGEGTPASQGGDPAVLEGIARALKPGGVAAISAFSAYFMVRWLEDGDTFDAATGVNHERTEIRDEQGEAREVDLWTTCFTPREFRFLAEQAGLAVQDIWSVRPGEYRRRAPSVETEEFLLVAQRPR